MTGVLAIDPGTYQSAIVQYENGTIHTKAIEDNHDLADYLHELRRFGATTPLAVEMVASYGMPVGREVFETCVWIGRFIEAYGAGRYVYRRDVKLHLCNSARAKDANIRQALLDKFPRSGGGKTPQIGVQSQPGPLYGVKSHLWSALAVAVCYVETEGAIADSAPTE
jgi:hypothetical protein